MSRKEKLVDVPESEVEKIREDYVSEGATVTEIRQLDGKYTVTALFDTPSHLMAIRAPQNLPFLSIGDLFLGREEMVETLGRQQTTVITQSQTLPGLGGIGKTRLAVEYAWRNVERYPAGLLFVSAETSGALYSGLTALAPQLQIPISPNQDAQVVAVLSWFQMNSDWLLIMDNVEATSPVIELLPNLTNGHVLITSRLASWPQNLQKLSLDTIEPDKAVSLLITQTSDRRAVKEDDQFQAAILAEKLDYLPLSLEQAASFIGQTRTSFAGYLNDWEKNRDVVLSWYNSQMMHYPLSVAVTWQTTFDLLSPMARTMLQVCGYLASGPIPVAMFENGKDHLKEAMESLGKEIRGRKVSWSVKSAIREQADFSLVTQSGETFTVHRMVQDVVRSRAPRKLKKNWIRWAAQIVNSNTPKDPNFLSSGLVWNDMRPHVARIVVIADQEGIVDPTTKMMNDLGLHLVQRNLFSEAENLYLRALAIDENALGSNHPSVARDLNNLASLFDATNRKEEAESLYHRALDIDEAFFGPGHLSVARDLNNLASLLETTNRKVEADLLFRRALAIKGHQINPYDPWNSVTPPRFLGRENEFLRLESALESKRSVSVVGDWRIGKTSLLKTWYDRQSEQGREVRLLSGQGPEGVSISAFVAAITGRPTEDDPDLAAEALSSWLQLGHQDLPPLVLVDEFEVIISRFAHRFFERIRGMLGRLVLVLATRQELDLIFENMNRTSPFYNRLEVLWLGLLEEDATETLIQWGKEILPSGYAEIMRRQAGRHPFYLQLLGKHLVDAQHAGLPPEKALDRFRAEATARLRNMWRSALNARDRERLFVTVNGQPCMHSVMKERGLVTNSGFPFGEVLATFLREDL